MFSIIPQDLADNPIDSQHDGKRRHTGQRVMKITAPEVTDYEHLCPFLLPEVYNEKEAPSTNDVLRVLQAPPPPHHPPPRIDVDDSSDAESTENRFYQEYFVGMEQNVQKQFDQHLLSLKQLLCEHHRSLLEAVEAASESKKNMRNSMRTGILQIEGNQATHLGSLGQVQDIIDIPGSTTLKSALKETRIEEGAKHDILTRTDEPTVKVDTPTPGTFAGRLKRTFTGNLNFTLDHTHSRERRREKSREMKKTWEENQRETVARIVRRHDNSAWHSQRRWLRNLVNKVRPRAAPKNQLAMVTRSRWFTTMTAFAILSNSLVIGMETDASVKAALNYEEDPAADFQVVNKVFTIFFVVELTLRIIGERCWFFVGPEWKWNVFDCVLVFHSVVMEVLEGANLSFARILRAFRMVRAARVIRVLRFFHELRRMVCSIMASLASLLWAFVLLGLIIYLVAIILIQGVSTYLKDGALDSSAVDCLNTWYNGLPMAMFSLTMSISGGVDWYDVAKPLNKMSWVYTIGFLAYVFFVIFGVLNVLVGVFLASAAEMLDRDIIVQSEMMRNTATMKEMLHLFEDIDTNDTGQISWIDFQEYLQDEKAQAFFQYNCFDTSDPQALFALMDADGDGHVDSQEFIMAMMKIRGQAKGSDMLTLVEESKRSAEQAAAAKNQLELLIQATQNQQDNVARMLQTFVEMSQAEEGAKTNE